MTRLALYSVLSLLLASTAWANDIVGCDPTHPLVPNAVTRVEYAVDFPPTPGFLVYVAPTNLDNPDRVAYLNSLKAQMDALKPVPHRYWLCTDTTPVDGVLESVREMTQAEKDALDAPEVAEQQRQQVFINEIATNDLCEAELSDIATRIDQVKTTLDARVDAAPNNIAGLKAYLKNDLHPALVTAFKKVAKCLRARAR